ncbi:MAG: hypothetical protein Q8Q08_06135 [Candidatus Omnitrophota bacterium]|nr:hypothetical protein [Candidatus Omnitrophota bacterium]MDZ4242035.1 hypothetical protein [Candidatus Omnitrophota bacterium]
MRSPIVLSSLFLSIILTVSGPVRADDWPSPREKDVLSENGMFAVKMVPPKFPEKTAVKPVVSVSEIVNGKKTLLWETALTNEWAPVEFFVSDNGRYVATLDNWHKVGYGDNVVAFYGPTGLARQYSLEEIVPLPEGKGYGDLFSHSKSSRWWTEKSVKFFSEFDSETYFCLWLEWDNRWLAWDPKDGRPLEVSTAMRPALDEKARQWALAKIEKSGDMAEPWEILPAYEFLGKLRRPEDAALIKPLLNSKQFFFGLTATNQELTHFTAYSTLRRRADRILALWDKLTDSDSGDDGVYYFLGQVKGQVVLGQVPEPEGGKVFVYLVSTEDSSGNWKYAPERLVADLRYAGTYKIGDTIPFVIEGVAPGSYRLKAVWDRAEPYCERDDFACPGSNGDFESGESAPVEVTAGGTVKDISLDCVIPVTGEPGD